MANLFKNKTLITGVTLLMLLFTSCSKENMQVITYRFISYSCISDASDCTDIYDIFPINENFIIYDTKSNADAQMIEMFKNFVAIVDSKQLGKKIYQGDYCRIHLCEIKDGESLQIIRDITCKEWRHIE